MSCESCSSPAVWCCQCSGVKLCDSCSDQHFISNPDAEHQILPIAEVQETYTERDLLEKPELIQRKIEEELERLERFREAVLEVLEQTCNQLQVASEDTVREWVAKWQPAMDSQKKGLESALEIVKTTRLIDRLPTDGYPWNLISDRLPPTFLKLPEEMGKVGIRFEDAIKVSITWDLPYTEAADTYTVAESQSMPEEQKAEVQSPEVESAEEEPLDLPSDPQSLYTVLQSDESLCARYFRSKYHDKSWKLRSLFPSPPASVGLSSVIVKGLASKDQAIFKDLALVLTHSPALEDLQVTGSSPSPEDFQLLCECIAKLPLVSLGLERCKLADANILELNRVIPATLKTLKLSLNYFAGDLLDREKMEGLEVLELGGIRVSSEWLDETQSLLPNLRIVQKS